MDRKRRISGIVLTIVSILNGCSQPEATSEIEILIRESQLVTKSVLPDEDLISDINIFVFDSYGKPVYNTFRSGSGAFSVNLLKGERYSVHACVNFGYKVTAQSRGELEGLRYHMAYPDEYRSGIPMYAQKDLFVEEQGIVVLEPVRFLSRISIRMDRSRLSEGVRMDVTSIKLGNCPKSISICGKSRVENEDGCFRNGFSHSGPSCAPLNTENSARLSEDLSLYMLENMQGRFSQEDIGKDEDKVFEDYDSRSRICSYVEIGMEYSSDAWISKKSPLKYRFYLGEDRNSLDVERNCHYHITVCPEDDGLKGDGWRVDKSGLEYTGAVSMRQFPGDYITGDIGDKIHIGCALTPSWAPFDAGVEYMEADKAEGIYDYQIDPDGHGATLTLTGPGRGLIYMEAGAPVNDAALFVIEVNRPE